MEEKTQEQVGEELKLDIRPDENKFNENYFQGVVGQDRLKKLLSFYINSFSKTQILPHIFLVGQKGGGKTYFGTELARNLKVANLNFCAKPLLTVNSSTIKSVGAFITDIYEPYILNKYITVFFDEVHDLPHKVQTALLSVLNPNKNNQTRLFYSGGEAHFNFQFCSFIFATTDPQSVISPLKDRCRMCHLQEYNLKELAEILTLNLDVQATPEALNAAAGVCRGNARNAVLMAKDNIVQYCSSHSIKTFGIEDWNKMQQDLGILPMGLEDSELQILRALENEPSLSLTGLSAKVGLSRMAIQREFEHYLLKHGLIKVEIGGRIITNKGNKYLHDLNQGNRQP